MLPALSPLRISCLSARAACCLHRYFAARLELVLAIRDHRLASAQSFINYSETALGHTGLYLPGLDTVIRFYDINKIPLRAALDRRCSLPPCPESRI